MSRVNQLWQDEVEGTPMVSPYLESEAVRLGISSKAEYRSEDYQFPRKRSDASYRDLEQSPAPLATWSHDLTAAIGYIIVIATACLVLSHLAGWVDAVEKIAGR